MELTIANETALSVVLTWPAVPDCSGYIFYVDGKKISSTADGTKTSISITKPDTTAHVYGVQPLAALGPLATIVVPAVPAPPAAFTITSSIKDGAVLSAPTPWVITSAKPLVQVRFYIDGNSEWIENYEPWVFNGDPGGVLDPATLSPGTHVLKAVASDSKGATGTVVSNVTVKAVTPTPTPTPTPQPTGAEGRVGFCMYATSQADAFDLSPVPSQAQKDWMNAHWNRAIIYVDSIASWLNGDWGYVDMLQIYVGSSVLAQHPEWVLRKASGAMVMYNSHYLADPGNPAYQDYKAAQIASMPARNYKGVHCDDVNLDRVVSGPDVINPRTHAPYTLGVWQKDMADMMTKVRSAAKAARSDFEVVHNALHWANGPDVDRCIKQCDVYELERGFCDPNDSVTGIWSFVDKIHSWGVAANFLADNAEGATTKGAHFNMACALLSSNGHDYHYGNTGWKPNAWDTTYDKDYGASAPPRYLVSAGVWARDFPRGTVAVNIPARTAVLP